MITHDDYIKERKAKDPEFKKRFECCYDEKYELFKETVECELEKERIIEWLIDELLTITIGEKDGYSYAECKELEILTRQDDMDEETLIHHIKDVIMAQLLYATENDDFDGIYYSRRNKWAH
jgi:hypothetical protein